MKKLLLLLVTSVLFFACSSDDDNDSEMTFLEKYNNTVWVYTDSESTEYARIHNNLAAPVEVWESSGDCYYYDDNIFADFTILENSEKKFELRYIEIYEGVEYKEIITIRIANDTLLADVHYYEDGALLISENRTMSKTTVNVDNLPLCD